ncbi:hypothetical protein [Bradyrhizobium sp. Ec3.3]|nr:hypothetical protein [Bradyrhizobium sp. Ec3.3]
MELAHLADAEERIALGEHHIAKQERIVAELDRDGHDVRNALALLDTFRQSQVQHVAHRDFILTRLAQEPRAPSGAIYQPGHYEGSEG